LIARFAEFSRSPMSIAKKNQLNRVLRSAVRHLRRLELERGIVE